MHDEPLGDIGVTWSDAWHQYHQKPGEFHKGFHIPNQWTHFLVQQELHSAEHYMEWDGCKKTEAIDIHGITNKFGLLILWYDGDGYCLVQVTKIIGLLVQFIYFEGTKVSTKYIFGHEYVFPCDW